MVARFTVWATQKPKIHKEMVARFTVWATQKPTRKGQQGLQCGPHKNPQEKGSKVYSVGHTKTHKKMVARLTVWTTHTVQTYTERVGKNNNKVHILIS